MSFVLVVVAAITLVIGLLQSGLGIIYVSIGCSVLAGIVLATAVLRGRPEPQGAGAPMPQRPASPPPSTPASAPDTWVAPSQPAVAPSPAPEPVGAGASGALGAGGVAVAEREDRTEAFDRVEVDEVQGDDGFPIHDYDRLRATEILPMLAELSDDQLEAVEERERTGKSRAMILNRIAAQKQSRAEAWDADDEGWDAAAGAEAPAGVGVEDEGDIDGETDTGVEPPGPVADRPVTAGIGEFPIPDFDELKALEVLGRLPDLSVTELHLVRRREEDGLRRAMVLNRIDRLIEEAPDEPEPVVVPPARRRSAASRAGGASAPSRRGAAARAVGAGDAAEPPAAPVAKRARKAASGADAPAKRARGTKAASETATKRAPARKSTASTRKALAESAPVAAAKKVAPSKRAAATKAVTAKKAAPAKRATKKR